MKEHPTNLMQACPGYTAGPEKTKVFGFLIDKSVLSGSSFLQTDARTITLSHDQTRKRQRFELDMVYREEKKMKAFLDENPAPVEGLFKGLSTTLLVFGREEYDKHRALFGVPRNPGLLMSMLLKIFQFAYKRNIETRVTLKLGAVCFKEGCFQDLLVPHQKPLTPVSERVQDDFLLGSTEVIVRNMKTAIKIMKIIHENLGQAKRAKEDVSGLQFIFTAKLEERVPGDSEHFRISRLRVFKLGEEVSLQNGREFLTPIFLEVVNLLQTIRNIERDRKDHILPHNSLFVEYLKNCVFRGSGLTALLLLNKRTSSVNSAYNSIMPSRLLASVRLHLFPKRVSREEELAEANGALSQITRVARSLLINLKKGRVLPGVARQGFSLLTLTQQAAKELADLLAQQMHQTFLLESLFSRYLTTQCQSYSKQINDDDPELFFQSKLDSGPELAEPVAKECAFWIDNLARSMSFIQLLREELKLPLRLAQAELASFQKVGWVKSGYSEMNFKLVQESNSEVMEFMQAIGQWADSFICNCLTLAQHWMLTKAPFQEFEALQTQLNLAAQDLARRAGLQAAQQAGSFSLYKQKFFTPAVKQYRAEQPPLSKRLTSSRKGTIAEPDDEEIDVIGMLHEQGWADYEKSHAEVQSILMENELEAERGVERALARNRHRQTKLGGKRARMMLDYSFDRLVYDMFNNESSSAS